MEKHGDLELKLRSTDLKLVEETLFWLVENKAENAIEHILKLKDHADADIRETVMICLGELHDSRALSHLIYSFENDLSENVRLSALSSMEEYPNDEVLKILINLTSSDIYNTRFKNEAYAMAKHYDDDKLRANLMQAARNTSNSLFTQTTILDSLLTMNNKHMYSFWEEIKNNFDNRYFYILSHRAIAEIELKETDVSELDIVRLSELDEIDVAIKLHRATALPNKAIWDKLIDLISNNELDGYYAYGNISLNLLIALIILEKGDQETIHKMVNVVSSNWSKTSRNNLLNYIEFTALEEKYKNISG